MQKNKDGGDTKNYSLKRANSDFKKARESKRTYPKSKQLTGNN
jgi:hypothetical protein